MVAWPLYLIATESLPDQGRIYIETISTAVQHFVLSSGAQNRCSLKDVCALEFILSLLLHPVLLSCSKTTHIILLLFPSKRTASSILSRHETTALRE